MTISISIVACMARAGLFNWALGEDAVTAEQARECASRSTGRPWIAHWDAIHALGALHARHLWPQLGHAELAAHPLNLDPRKRELNDWPRKGCC